MLRERAAEAERLRRMPDETVEAFRQAGFYRALQPKRYGGYEFDYGAQTELAIALGPGCASSAWDASITACHSWLIGMFPAETQDEVWGDDPENMISTSFLALEARATRAGDGIRLGGRWGFSSGIGHCAWAILAFAIEDGDGPPDPMLALLPLSDCDVLDTWDVTGLTGTGSNDIAVDDVIVPAHRVLRVMELRGDPTPGSAVNPNYNYHLPMHGVFSFNIIGTAIGAARGAIETVIAEMGARAPVTQARLAGLQSVHLRLGEALGAVDAAEALVLRNLDEIHRLGRDGVMPDIGARTRYRTDNGFAARLCVQAIDAIYPLTGGRGIASGDPTNRAWRDIHAVAHHIALSWDVQGHLYGATSLGLPCPDPKI